MRREVIECEEFGELQVGLGQLMENGQLQIDERISGRGYLNVSLRRGQVVLRADRHVGLIPINDRTAVRVRPRSTVNNLSHMLARSGVAPVAIADFSRGYVPRFEAGPQVEKLYAKSLIQGVDRVVGRGLLKSYSRISNPPAWRGRLLVADTIKQITRGIRFRPEFEFHELSVTAIENIALKEALKQLQAWMRREDRRNPDLVTITRLLNELRHVADWHGRMGALVAETGRRAALLAPHLAHYRDPLWTAFLLLQSKLPDLSHDGSVTLDSLIIDVSKVFEAYIRRVLVDRVSSRGWNVRDGNLKPSAFFTDAGTYEVRPDIVIAEGRTPLAVLDAKYKLEPKESDRYELLAFMDALGVKRGGFILPQSANVGSRYLGTTRGERSMSSLRFDLSVADLEAEGDRLFANAVALIEGKSQYR